MPAPSFAQRVVRWQQRHGRHTLPWQRTRDPYRVWLSEIMLQQTQVATVVPYFERFLRRFPDVRALAEASLDEVLSAWSGLGYYTRARNLHRCARVVVEEYGAKFPPASIELARLPGIGRSTAAAIAAFCFGERAAILDGNVKRVLARVFAFDGDLSTASAEREMWKLAHDLLPHDGVDRYSQGLMDLGATICTVSDPNCTACPVRDGCVAASTATQHHFPVKSRRLARGTREHVWLWLAWRGQWWLVRRATQGVWAGLWSLPEFDTPADFDAASVSWPGQGERLPSLTHTLTHLDWTLHPVRWTLPPRTGESRVASLVAKWPSGRWFSRDGALSMGLPAPLRKLLAP